MKNTDPTSLLYWVENQVANLLQIADDALPHLSDKDADAVHQHRLEAETTWGRLEPVLSRLLRQAPMDAIEFGICVSQLIQAALAIGIRVPARTETDSNRQTEKGRLAKAQKPPAIARDAAFNAAVPHDWSAWKRSDLVDHIMGKANEILRRQNIEIFREAAVRQRLTRMERKNV